LESPKHDHCNPDAIEIAANVAKLLGSRYRSGRSPRRLKIKNPAAPAVKRETEVDWRW